MRILCLHGVGSSGKICESQFLPLLKHIDPSYEFIFVDGPVECERGPGMGAYPEGPFFSHTTGYSPNKMLEALEHLDVIVDELGPFDGVFGFSQGAAIALSYIHRQQEMGRAAPFKFALCFSSVCPCSSDELYCQQILRRLSALQWDDTNPSSADEKSLSPNDHLVKEFLYRVAVPALKNNGLLPAFDMKVYKSIGGSDSPRVMHGQLVKEKIRIPTVHISGKRDFAFMRAMSDVAHGLCEERLTRKVEHGGGHQPPQKHAEIKSVLRAMEWAINQSEREMVWHL